MRSARCCRRVLLLVVLAAVWPARAAAPTSARSSKASAVLNRVSQLPSRLHRPDNRIAQPPLDRYGNAGIQRIAAAFGGLVLLVVIVVPPLRRSVLNPGDNHPWPLAFAYVLPALAAASVVQAHHWIGSLRFAIYLAGIMVSVILVRVTGSEIAVRRRDSTKKRLLEKFESEGIPVSKLDGELVGFAPGPNPRFYLTGYNWDSGFLLFGKDQISYLGEQARFTLTSAQVLDVWLGQGPPAWSHVPRIYVRWRDEESGRDGIFSIISGEPCSMFVVNKQIHALYRRLQAWLENPTAAEALPEPLNAYEPPKFAEITSRSPRELGSIASALKNTLFFMFPIALGFCVLLRLQHYSYVLGVVVLTRFYLLIPYWRYRDLYKPVPHATAPPPKAQAASAS